MLDRIHVWLHKEHDHIPDQVQVLRSDPGIAAGELQAKSGAKPEVTAAAAAAVAVAAAASVSIILVVMWEFPKMWGTWYGPN